MPEFQASHYFILKILQCRIFTAFLIGIANLFRNYLLLKMIPKLLYIFYSLLQYKTTFFFRDISTYKKRILCKRICEAKQLLGSGDPL